MSSTLQNNNTSAYVRIPFTATGLESIDLLRLRMQTDDAFVASINGTEVARDGVTGPVQWNSAADTDRPDGDAFLADEFFIANQPGLLVDGQNILAIQLLNLDVAATRGLVLPELDAIASQRSQRLIADSIAATALVPSDNSLGIDWTGGNEPFNDTGWISGTTGVGYDSGPGGPVGGPVAYWTFDSLTGGGLTAPDSKTSQYGGLVSHGGTSPFSIGLARPGQNEWGDFEGLVDDVAIWDAALNPTQVASLFNGTSPLLLSGYDDRIGIDLEAQLAGQNTSAYTRIPFTVDDPNSVVSLNVKLQYDDAFVAYINGAEVARSNFTGTPLFDSAADTDRQDLNALTADEFFMVNQPGLLQLGTNILAIQVLNASAGAERLLVLPEIEVVTVPDRAFAFMETPTPGTTNGVDLTAVAMPVDFSVPAGTFTSDFQLELTTEHAGGEIRYTTDRSLPTESSPLYMGPLLITETTMVRARVYLPDLVPGESVSQTYIELGGVVVDDSSNLPIIVVDNFGQGDLNDGFDLSHRQFQNGSVMVFEPAATGRTHLTDTPTFTSRSGTHRRGNSSFSNPKPSLRLELRDENDSDLRAPLLGMASDADWILQGPYDEDRSLIRNSLVHATERQTGRWAPNTRFVEVYYNTNGGALDSFTEYMGVYALTERVEINPNRINIPSLSPNDNLGSDLTGGYLFEINNPKVGDTTWHVTQSQVPFIHIDPDAARTTEQQNYIEGYVQDFADAAFSPSFKDPNLGYRDFLDTDSLINHHLLRFAFDEPQGFVVSEFWFKDRDGNLQQGPVWDSDRAIGNPHDQYDFFPTPQRIFTESYFDPPAFQYEATWLKQFFLDEDFAQDWVDRWWELRQDVFTAENFTSIVDSFAAEIAEAQVRNEQRWNEGFLGPYPEAEAGLTGWEAEISQIKGWLEGRIDFVDSLLLHPVTLNSSVGATAPFEVTLSSPQGTIYYTLDGSDPRAPGGQISAQATQYTGQPIEITDTARVIARAFDANAQPLAGTSAELSQWSGPTTQDFVINLDVVITEINYNPLDPSDAEKALIPGVNNDDFEFVEVHNTTDGPVDLAATQLTQVIDSSLPLNDSQNWRASTEFGGSPGAAGVGPLGTVIINEVLTNSDAPAVDVVELYNLTGMPVSIDGWWLTDKASQPDRYVISGGKTVPAGGYLLLDETELGFGFNSTAGDQVWLIQPGNMGSSHLIVDQVEFGAAATGVSFGRFPNAVGKLFPMVSTTLAADNSVPRFGPVVVSEVMYNPADPMAGIDSQLLEFVEIYNSTARTVDLANWRIEGVGNFDFPQGTLIGPGQFKVVVPFDPVADLTEISAFNAVYDVNIAAYPSNYVGPYAGRLDNGGEQVTLLRADDPPPGEPATVPLVIEDQIDFDDEVPWPLEPDGTGSSLHRQLVDLWGNDAVSWIEGVPSPGVFGPNSVSTFMPADLGSSVIGEAGTVASLTHEHQVVMLNHTFNNPVIFAQPASYNGMDPVAVRITDIQADRFTLYLTEPSNGNAMHGGESVSYLVVEEGTHRLSDGTLLEVGKVTTTATVGLFANNQWETVNLVTTFGDTPVAIAQIQTTNGLGYLQSRQRQLNSIQVELALEPEEILGSQQPAETLGYLAMEAGQGNWSGLAYETRTTADSLTHDFLTVNFAQIYSAPPVFLSSLASYDDGNNAHLRHRNLTTGGVDLKVKEDTTWDTEVSHSTEEASYLAIGGAGLLSATGSQTSNGETRSFPLTVPATGRVADLNATLDLDHTQTSDLNVVLVGPDGTPVQLFSGVGGAGINFTNTTLDDEAATPIVSATAPFTGSFQPEGSLADFDGRPSAGTWTLQITDDAVNPDVGSLLDWSLTLDVAIDPTGNVNHDGTIDADDIDLLYANLGSGGATYDLDGDGDADAADVNELVLNLIGTQYGDADVDLDVDIVDFNLIAVNFDPAGQDDWHGWAMGNFDGDSDIDWTDLRDVVLNYAPLGVPLSVTGSSQSGAIAVSTRQPVDAATMTFPTGEVSPNSTQNTGEIHITPSDVIFEPIRPRVAPQGIVAGPFDVSLAQLSPRGKNVDRVFQETDPWSQAWSY